MTKIKAYADLPLSTREISRYARCAEDSFPPFFDDCLLEAKQAFSYRLCFDIFDLRFQPDGTLAFGGAEVRSDDLKKNLNGCSRILLFAATAGMKIDLLIRKYTALSPAKAVLFQAVGSAGVEALCDRFCADLEVDFGNIKPRFSPGYGDFSLEFQKTVFSILEPQKHIGVSLGENLLMTPSKSVTAIVGLLDS